MHLSRQGIIVKALSEDPVDRKFFKNRFLLDSKENETICFQLSQITMILSIKVWDIPAVHILNGKPYLVSHLGGYALQTNRINIWASLQKDMYERNYLNRNLVFNQQLGIQPKVTTPILTATNVQGSNQYISIPVLWRNYYDIVGFHQNKFSGELWLEPKIVDTSGHQLQNALVITPDGYSTINYISYGDSFQNQKIIFTPDKPMYVSAFYVWDLYADSASAITCVKVNGINSTYSRVVSGDQSHIKINWSGTIPTSGITIIIEGKAKSGLRYSKSS